MKKKKFVSISLLNGSLFGFFFFLFSAVDFFFLSDDFLFLGNDSSRLIINSLRHTNNQEGPRPFGLAGAEFVSSPATSKPRHLLHFQHSVTQTLTSVLSSYRQTGRVKKWLNAAPSGLRRRPPCCRQGLISSILVRLVQCTDLHVWAP